ncbi:RagB/SusD family nutrient uptake outer membrane protein [Algoriphagus boritolerans]|uniref:Starch-binding associating with outer membrane n=1 Tax=Algoriphagus boritolerans DSM 17298 = JCM 18970 TaxID=1120964 RepID=A0A1H5TIE7_9BACT|nr:RagB/SusD family nutrient uptake outer membrane protein [Algoriphagus boritolerans]SEF62544.1 Starch-binding associating with outer membrane [Algoriphagus boritolerans DSM 17298 = JCM 18970]
MNTYQIKSWIKTSALAVTLSLAFSCQDALQEDVISQIGNDYLNTAKGLEDGVNAAYTSLRVWYGSERGNNFTEFGTDIYTNGADGSWKFMNTYTNQFDSQNGHVRELWDELYRGINTCNAVIDRSVNVTGISEAVKKQRIAEVKFIRAHHYFLLVQLFGPVDLQLTENKVPNKVVTRAPVAAVYDAIINDLQTAIPDLEAVKASNQYGRATRPAAQHLLAKVFITRATSEAGQASDYASAEPLLKSVINDYGFILLPNYAQIHQFGNERNDEIVFAIQYTRDPLTNQQANTPANPSANNGNNSHLYFLMEYDVQPGMRRDTQNGRPFKRYRMTPYAINTVFGDRVNDSRYKASFIDVYYANRPGTYNTNFDLSKPSVTFALGDTAIYIPGFEMSLAERATKKYQVLVPSRYDERLFPPLKKHLDPGRADLTQEQGGRDYPAMRLGETYLLLAESLLRQGKVAEATDAMNAVRRRAAFPGKQAAMEITPAQMTMEFLMEERARELTGEQVRWLDLKRWNVLVERVKLHNAQAAPNIKDFHVLRPIPQNQIDRAEGGASGFPQNPGY